MATKVTDYFKVLKGNTDIHPSKRRKLGIASNSSLEVKPVVLTPPVSQRTRARAKAPTQKTVQIKNTRTKKTHKSKNQEYSDSSQLKIQEAFSKLQNLDETPENSVLEEATAACDDHSASPPGTPHKRSSIVEDNWRLKRSRFTNAVRKDLLKEFDTNTASEIKFAVPNTPERNFDFNKQQSAEVAIRRKLQIKSTSESSTVSIAAQDEKAKIFQFTGCKSQKKSEVKEENESKHNTLSLNKPKATLKLDKTAMAEKLKKCGKLAELQKKLAQFTEKSQELKSPIKKYKPKLIEPSPAKCPNTPVKLIRSTPKTPAFERFDTLASPISPSLTLPFKYKQLLDKFIGMDTVVSMLHKRSEICTFSKLKAAVQEMTRKTFEMKHVGQIKTVYPSAYTFRQEKGLPAFGNKVIGYQLTVEANLDALIGKKTVDVDKYGKPAFTASHLSKRKDTFHRNLLHVVKDFHKTFLSSLERPLSIPDSKLSRWHPKFPLENVTDIEEGGLPQPPETSKKLSTAKAVLEEAKGNLHSRIQRTLELMCGEETKKNTAETKTPVKKDKNNSPSTTTFVKNSPIKVDPALKGVPASLLEKIRAKEARKAELTMMRTPEDERRLERMERLPELSRILRTFFVTQKKPALLEENVISKLAESYKSNLGKAETEKHLELIRTLVPDWLQVVSIKKGKYIKLDKNKDITVIQAKLQKLYNEAK